jgi:formate transporter
MYFLPIALLVREYAPDAFWRQIGRPAADFPDLTVANAIVLNLVPVTIGNVVGGAGLVGIVYWFVYRRGRAAA